MGSACRVRGREKDRTPREWSVGFYTYKNTVGHPITNVFQDTPPVPIVDFPLHSSAARMVRATGLMSFVPDVQGSS